MYKLGHLVNNIWTEHSHPAVFTLPEDEKELQCIVAGAPQGDPEIFRRLVCTLEPPYILLYVLHTPRGEAAPGRYQSPELSEQRFQNFIAEFGTLLSGDSRFDIWAYSPSERATIVWDRHNQIFAYGPLSRFETELHALGYSQGSVTVPVPHEDCYHSELDEIAKEVLDAFEWSYSPLRPEDEQ